MDGLDQALVRAADHLATSIGLLISAVMFEFVERRQ